MRLAGSLIRLPLALVGEAVDRLLGPKEAFEYRYSTTPPDDVLRADPNGYLKNGFDPMVDDHVPNGFGIEIIKAGTGWPDVRQA